jgi:hypothetical protein
LQDFFNRFAPCPQMVARPWHERRRYLRGPPQLARDPCAGERIAEGLGAHADHIGTGLEQVGGMSSRLY